MTDNTISSLRPAKTTLLKKFERVFDDPVSNPEPAGGKPPEVTQQKHSLTEPATETGIPETMQVYKQGGAVSEVNLSMIGSKFDTVA